MIIRKTPKDKGKYIAIIDKNLSYELQLNGFMPKYIDEIASYFLKTEKIENFIKENSDGRY